MTSHESQNLDESIALTVDTEALSGKDAESHPFELREGLEPWRRGLALDPQLRLGSSKERKTMGKALQEKNRHRKSCEMEAARQPP